MPLVDTEDLYRWLNCTRDADAVRKLKEYKIPYVEGIGGRPATTTELINAALHPGGVTVSGHSSISEINFGE